MLLAHARRRAALRGRLRAFGAPGLRRSSRAALLRPQAPHGLPSSSTGPSAPVWMADVRLLGRLSMEAGVAALILFAFPASLLSTKLLQSLQIGLLQERMWQRAADLDAAVPSGPFSFFSPSSGAAAPPASSPEAFAHRLALEAERDLRETSILTRLTYAAANWTALFQIGAYGAVTSLLMPQSAAMRAAADDRLRSWMRPRRLCYAFFGCVFLQTISDALIVLLETHPRAEAPAGAPWAQVVPRSDVHSNLIAREMTRDPQKEAVLRRCALEAKAMEGGRGRGGAFTVLPAPKKREKSAKNGEKSEKTGEKSAKNGEKSAKNGEKSEKNADKKEKNGAEDGAAGAHAAHLARVVRPVGGDGSHPLHSYLKVTFASDTAAFLLTQLAVLGPVLEEVLFRGLIARRMLYATAAHAAGLGFARRTALHAPRAPAALQKNRKGVEIPQNSEINRNGVGALRRWWGLGPTVLVPCGLFGLAHEGNLRVGEGEGRPEGSWGQILLRLPYYSAGALLSGAFAYTGGSLAVPTAAHVLQNLRLVAERVAGLEGPVYEAASLADLGPDLLSTGVLKLAWPAWAAAWAPRGLFGGPGDPPRRLEGVGLTAAGSRPSAWVRQDLTPGPLALALAAAPPEPLETFPQSPTAFGATRSLEFRRAAVAKQNWIGVGLAAGADPDARARRIAAAVAVHMMAVGPAEAMDGLGEWLAAHAEAVEVDGGRWRLTLREG